MISIEIREKLISDFYIFGYITVFFLTATIYQKVFDYSKVYFSLNSIKYCTDIC